jgi:hypothetical protein
VTLENLCAYFGIIKLLEATYVQKKKRLDIGEVPRLVYGRVNVEG